MENNDVKNNLSAKSGKYKDSDLEIYEALKNNEVLDTLEKDILPDKKN